MKCTICGSTHIPTAHSFYKCASVLMIVQNSLWIILLSLLKSSLALSSNFQSPFHSFLCPDYVNKVRDYIFPLLCSPVSAFWDCN